MCKRTIKDRVAPAMLTLCLMFFSFAAGDSFRAWRVKLDAAPPVSEPLSAERSEIPAVPQAGSISETAEVLSDLSDCATVSLRVTGYCGGPCCCGQFSDGITASGKSVTYNEGCFAAGPSWMTFGTLVDVPGYGLVEVIDRGGAIKGSRLGVFFPTHQEALNWGVRQLDVCVLFPFPLE